MKTIILVEDDADIRDVFTLVFDPRYYLISIYDSGSYILQEKIKIPDLFIIDKNISGIDGLDVIRFIKHCEYYKGIPVILLSASPNIKELAQQVDADDILAKPFSLVILRELVLKYTS